MIELVDKIFEALSGEIDHDLNSGSDLTQNVRRTVKALMGIMQKVRNPKSGTQNISDIVDASTGILKWVNPVLEPKLDLITNMVAVIENQIQSHTNFQSPQSLLLSAHRIVSLIDPSQRSSLMQIRTILEKLLAINLEEQVDKLPDPHMKLLSCFSNVLY